MTTLRQLTIDEMAAASRVHRASFDDQLPWLAGLHTPEEDAAFYRDHMFATGEVWGGFDRETLVGVMVLKGDLVEQLYILPAAQGRGVGHALLTLAMDRGGPLQLWTFQRNTRARAFYQAHGFVAMRLTDGADNEEKEPDVLYAWPGRGGAI